jgi:hypothetical protein
MERGKLPGPALVHVGGERVSLLWGGPTVFTVGPGEEPHSLLFYLPSICFILSLAFYPASLLLTKLSILLFHGVIDRADFKLSAAPPYPR